MQIRIESYEKSNHLNDLLYDKYGQELINLRKEMDEVLASMYKKKKN